MDEGGSVDDDAVDAAGLLFREGAGPRFCC